MSEIFNLKRFGTYFLYDLRQMWRKHSRAAILIGGSIVIVYVVWGLVSLIFEQSWSSPGITVRLVMLTFAFSILEIYQARTYGFVTDRQEGADYLLIPASRTEKFISMLLMTLVVIPLLFFVVFFTLDGLLSLVDPAYGKALFLGCMDSYQRLLEGLSMIEGESPVVFTKAALFFLGLVGFVCNFMYFLLCGICFKRHKIIWAILILSGLSTLLSIVSVILVPVLAMRYPSLEVDPIRIARFTAGMLNGTEIFCCVLAVGLSWGIWRRIKTLQH